MDDSTQRPGFVPISGGANNRGELCGGISRTRAASFVLSGDLGFSADEGRAPVITDVHAAVNLPTVRLDESEDAHLFNKSG